MAENSDISERGSKIRAGQLLSQYIRVIAQELESVTDDGETLTKAELLARQIWKKALAGDKTSIAIIFNRMEGRPPIADSSKDPRSKFPIADNVSAAGKKKLNNLVDNG